MGGLRFIGDSGEFGSYPTGVRTVKVSLYLDGPNPDRKEETKRGYRAWSSRDAQDVRVRKCCQLEQDKLNFLLLTHYFLLHAYHLTGSMFRPKHTGAKNVIEKTREIQICTPPFGPPGIKMYLDEKILLKNEWKVKFTVSLFDHSRTFLKLEKINSLRNA